MRDIDSPLDGIRSPFGVGGDALRRYALADGGVFYRPLAVFNAGTQSAYRRDVAPEDYQLADGGTNYTPLAVFDASNGIATRG